MSGDISFSYPYDKNSPTIRRYVDLFSKSLESFHRPDWAHLKAVGRPNSVSLDAKDWVMIFSRDNNFGSGKGIWIKDEIVFCRSIEGEIIQYPIDKVVFASSSGLEDLAHMKKFEMEHKIHHSRIVICRSRLIFIYFTAIHTII